MDNNTEFNKKGILVEGEKGLNKLIASQKRKLKVISIIRQLVSLSLIFFSFRVVLSLFLGNIIMSIIPLVLVFIIFMKIESLVQVDMDIMKIYYRTKEVIEKQNIDKHFVMHFSDNCRKVKVKILEENEI